MNVCNDCSSLIIVRDEWPTRNNPQITDPSARGAGADLDAQWYRAREQAERAAAKCASSIDARRVHQELAQAYARLARQMEERMK